MQAAVVKGSAPLLVSRPALKRLGATINFADDRLKLLHDRLERPLQVVPSELGRAVYGRCDAV